jgi:hypothetical protein
MSATNRGSKRIPSDNYSTPMESINAFLDHYYAMNDLTILEPAAGSGNICKAIKNRYPGAYIVANELREEENDNLSMCADQIHNEDFLKFEKNSIKYDLIIGNPPFSLAKEFLEHCFKVANDQTDIVMLLRLAFLESRERYKFWKEHPISELYVLHKRPKFINGKSDATAYGFFVWQCRAYKKNCNKQGIYVI